MERRGTHSRTALPAWSCCPRLLTVKEIDGGIRFRNRTAALVDLAPDGKLHDRILEDVMRRIGLIMGLTAFAAASALAAEPAAIDRSKIPALT
jgi:hypothetical protein